MCGGCACVQVWGLGEEGHEWVQVSVGVCISGVLHITVSRVVHLYSEAACCCLKTQANERGVVHMRVCWVCSGSTCCLCKAVSQIIAPSDVYICERSVFEFQDLCFRLFQDTLG